MGPPACPPVPPGGAPPPVSPLGLGAGATPGSRGRLFFVAVSEGMWRGLGVAEAVSPPRVGVGAFFSSSESLRAPGLPLSGAGSTNAQVRTLVSQVSTSSKASFSLSPLFLRGPLPARPQGGS